MNSLYKLLETYLLVLVHPFRIHQQFRYNVALPHHDGQFYKPLTLAESIGISWIFAIIRGLGKIIILNFFLQTFLSMQSENFPFLQEFLQSSSSSTYYFLLFSAALDIIFFPIATIVLTEVWAWLIKKYAEWLNPELPAEEIADQITTHALSSHIFNIIPFIGDVLQSLSYFFLLYAGLRSNLGAVTVSRLGYPYDPYSIFHDAPEYVIYWVFLFSELNLSAELNKYFLTAMQNQTVEKPGFIVIFRHI